MMANAVLASDWDHTAALLAQQFNFHRPKGSRPRQPSEVNPFQGTRGPRRRQGTSPGELRELAGLFRVHQHVTIHPDGTVSETVIRQ